MSATANELAEKLRPGGRTPNCPWFPAGSDPQPLIFLQGELAGSPGIRLFGIVESRLWLNELDSVVPTESLNR
jgi:hypothetical protein